MQTRHHGIWPAGLPHSLPPSPHSVYRNLVDATETAPDRVAIVDGGQSLTYRALHDQVRRMAGYLHGAARIGPRDRVGLFLQNALEFVVAYYAVLAANAVVVPNNPMSRREELRHILQDSGARVIVFGEDLAPEIDAIWAACGRPVPISVRYADAAGAARGSAACDVADFGMPWDAALAAAHPAPAHVAGPADWCLVPYSSGTTGRPKGCLHVHAAVNATIRACAPWIGMARGARVLATLPFCHVTGMQHSMNLPIHTASTIYLARRWNAEAAARLIEREGIEHWRSITTTMIDFLSLPGIEHVDLSSLRAIGGAQMPESLARKMKRLTGLDYIEAYGLNETMAPTHINPPHAPKNQCLGIPIFDVDSRVVDPETLQERGPGVPGEIVTHAPQVIVEYWQRPDETAAAFVQIDGKRFFRMGDIGYADAQGYFSSSTG